MRNLYIYETNESIAAKATMNCLKNRNTYKTEEQEENNWDEVEGTKVTVKTPMGLKQMFLSKEVIEAYIRKTDSDDFLDRSAVRVISWIVRDMMETGYTPTPDEQKIVDIQNAIIRRAIEIDNENTDRRMWAFYN